jgi:predicted TIM-barrel fold metal-dependent hydrolase
VGFIDADGHLFETEETWDYLDPSDRIHRPRLLQFAEPEAPGLEPPFHWIVGDTWARRIPATGNVYDNGNVYSPGTLDLTDPAKRVQDLDTLGIDAQVIHSSFFISTELENADVEAAITRAYNRWVAAKLSGYTDRLRWTLRPPTRNIARALEEIKFGKEHGAAGIALMGIEHGLYLADRTFWPIYELAQDLDLPIIIHLGTSIRRHNIPVGKLIPSQAALTDHVYPLMSGFHSVIASDFHERFPRLRFGFVEGGATWVPAILQFQARCSASASRDEFLKIRYMTPDEIEARNVFIACESDEDIPYLTKWVGENVLCTGTDYGHNDAGGELGVHESILRRTDLTSSVADKIVDANGRKLYGIDAGFTPAPPLGSGGSLGISNARYSEQEPFRYASV